MAYAVPALADVIAEVNRLRAERGLPTIAALPAGTRSKPDHCPVARALSNGVHVRFYPGSELLFIGEESISPPPEVLSEFAFAFDRGEFPGLEA